MLGGVFRSSISLVVIMVEGTGGITFVFCIIVAVVVSNAVSSWLQKHGVYHMDLHRNDNVAYLSGEPAEARVAHREGSDGVPRVVRRRDRATFEGADSADRDVAQRLPGGGPPGAAGGHVPAVAADVIHGDKHARPGSHPGVRRALDTYMRVAHLRRRPMPRPLLPRRYPPATALSAARSPSTIERCQTREGDFRPRRGKETIAGRGPRRTPAERRVRRHARRRRRTGGVRRRGALGRGRAPAVASAGEGARQRGIRVGVWRKRAGSPPCRKTAQLEQDSESNAHGSTSASESVDGGVPSRPASRGGVERQQSRFAQFQAEVAAAGAAPPGGGQFPSHHASYRPPVFELGQIRDSSNEDDDETLDDEGAAGLDVASFMHRAPLAVQADFPGDEGVLGVYHARVAPPSP